MAINLGNQFVCNTWQILGSGGFGTVYRGKQLGTNADVAVKKTNLSKESIDEFNLVIYLNHSNLIKHFAAYTYNNSFYVVMELCLYDLEHLLSQLFRLRSPMLKSAVRQIVAGCGELHSRNIIHRDIKPKNILVYRFDNITGQIHLKIADFGLAVLPIATYATTVCGTAIYVAPEIYPLLTRQMIGRGHYDSRADIWSIGLIIWQCLVGKFPFNANDFSTITYQVLRGDTNYNYTPPAECSEQWQTQAIERCLWLNYHNRCYVHELYGIVN